MSFDAGALIFRIQTAGASTAKSELREFDQATKQVGQSSTDAAVKVTGVGNATDGAGKKARDAQGRFIAQATATKRVGDESATAAPKQQKQAASSEAQTAAARQLSTALLAAGVAVGALVGLSVVKYAQFDQQMSNVAAATMATAKEQKVLAEAALDAGAKTAYSANEAAAAQENLAKAGLTTAEIVGGSLNGALSLAAAGQLEVARSADIMATTLKQFNLPASEAAHVSDLLAAGAGKAQGSVEDLGLALTYVGPVAAGLKISIDETSGALAYLASQGILGEKAGTGLRGVLMSLTAPSSIATKTMAEYGIEIFDSAGNMKSLAEVSEILKARLGGLTEAERSAALGRIFGNEQITTARILYAGGADAIEKWTAAVDDSGYAADQAAKRQDNLAGDVEKLGGAFDTAFIKTGAGANDVLRDMVQMVTGLVDSYGQLDPAVQSTVLILGAGAAALLLLYGGGLKATIALSELKRASELLNISMKTTSLIAGGAAFALTGIIAVVTLLAAQQAEAQAKAKAYADTFEAGSRRITKATRDMAKENLAAKNSFLWIEQDSAYDAAEKLGISLELVTDAATGNAEAMKELQTQLKAAEDGSLATSNSITDVENAVRGESDSLEQAIEITKQKNRATDDSVESNKSAKDSYLETAGSVSDLNKNLSDLIDTINEANGVGQDAVTANLDYKNALFEVDEVIRKAKEGLDENADGVADYIATLDEATQAGRDNKAMLVDLAQQSQDAAKAQFDLDHNTDAYRANLEAGRQAILDRAADLGLNADEAAALADQIYRIPSETEWKVIADTVPAINAVNGFIRAYDGKVITLRIGAQGEQTYSRDGGNTTYQKDGGHVEFYAGGGMRRENHVAQMARAGTWRVWAEDETGGETYIPHAPSKRSRSERVLAETAAMFGGQYIPPGAQRFAEGGYQSSAAPARTQGGDIIHINTRDTPDMTGAELAHLLVGEIKWLRRR